MDKCCDACRNRTNEYKCRRLNKTAYAFIELGGFELWEDWDTAKDYCSKWEEKEGNIAKLSDEILKIEKNNNEHGGSYSYQRKSTRELIVRYFKQRIEESLDKGFGTHMAMRNRLWVDKDNVKKAFSWILDN